MLLSRNRINIPVMRFGARAFARHVERDAGDLASLVLAQIQIIQIEGNRLIGRSAAEGILLNGRTFACVKSYPSDTLS